jgi:hypothetical protein
MNLKLFVLLCLISVAVFSCRKKDFSEMSHFDEAVAMSSSLEAELTPEDVITYFEEQANGCVGFHAFSTPTCDYNYARLQGFYKTTADITTAPISAGGITTYPVNALVYDSKDSATGYLDLYGSAQAIDIRFKDTTNTLHQHQVEFSFPTLFYLTNPDDFKIGEELFVSKSITWSYDNTEGNYILIKMKQHITDTTFRTKVIAVPETSGSYAFSSGDLSPFESDPENLIEVTVCRARVQMYDNLDGKNFIIGAASSVVVSLPKQ